MADPAYDYAHQQRRAELLPKAYNTLCPRCQKPMLRGQELDLGHSDDLALNPNAVGDRIEHASCNRKAGAQLGAIVSKLAPSRDW